MLRARHDDERVIKEKIEALSLVCNAAESPCNQEIDVALAQLTVQTRRISLSLAPGYEFNLPFERPGVGSDGGPRR